MVVSVVSRRKEAVALGGGVFLFLTVLGFSFVPRVKNQIHFQDAVPEEQFTGVASADGPAIAENLIRFPKDDLYSYSRGDGIQHFQTKSSVVFDRIIGPKARPHFQRRHMMKKDGQTIYDVESMTDGYSRRITPTKSTRKNHILFFGCSYVFGEGVRQDETLPFYSSQAARDSVGYNYAFGGWGPNNNLARLQLPMGPNEVPESNGVGVYVFLDFHIQRAIAALSTARFSHNFPHYSLENDHRLIRAGFNKGQQPQRFQIYQWLNNSWLAQRLKFDWPLVLQEQDYMYTARLIQQIKVEYQKKFPGQKFYVLFYPQTKTRSRMANAFQKLDVEFIDYADVDLRKSVGGNDVIPFDGHPTPLAHQWIAKKLIQDLGI